MKRIKFYLAIVCIFISNLVFASQADVVDICGRNYFPTVHEIFQNAQKSIYVVMYFANFNPNKVDNVNVLVNDLVDAHKRGVKVKVILDRNVEYSKGEEFGVREKNSRAFEYLKSNGVEVYFDNDNTLTHAKSIVVDENIVIVGSTNWSANSMDVNNETAVVIRSDELAKKFINYFNTIAIDKEESNKEAVSYVTLSKNVLTGPLADYVRTDNKGCWNLLMWLVGRYKTGEKIDFDYDVVDLDLDVHEDKDRYRSRLNENLKKLSSRYSLITANVEYGKNAEVVLTTKLNEGKTLFEIPDTFWKYNWQKRLSLPAQFCLFINFMESGANHNKWFRGKELLAKEFKVSHSVISSGMIELKRWNLIDIEWGSIEKGFADRPANRFRLKNLYSMDDFNSELEKLKTKYSAEKVEKARELAKTILGENNLQDIEDIILLTEQYGADRVQMAFEKVSKYKIDNPMRSLRYVVGVVRGVEK